MPNQALRVTRPATSVLGVYSSLSRAGQVSLVVRPQKAMLLQKGQALEIFFGTREGDCIRFEVLGPTCPDAEEDWYRAHLDAEIHVAVGTFRGYRSLVMFSDDFHLFRAALTRLLSGEVAGAWLETGDYLSFEVRAADSVYKVWMQLDALEREGEEAPRNGGTENWEWRLTMDRASLDALLAAVARVSEHYPTWSVSRG